MQLERTEGFTLNHDLQYFKLSEFRHPDLINERAALLLNDIRAVYGEPLTVTDDARTPDEQPPGFATDSLHYKGQAFDLRTRDLTREQLWRLVRSVYTVSVGQGGVELELVSSSTDHHLHVGFFFDGRADRLIVRAE